MTMNALNTDHNLVELLNYFRNFRTWRWLAVPAQWAHTPPWICQAKARWFISRPIGRSLQYPIDDTPIGLLLMERWFPSKQFLWKHEKWTRINRTMPDTYQCGHPERIHIPWNGCLSSLQELRGHPTWRASKVAFNCHAERGCCQSRKSKIG